MLAQYMREKRPALKRRDPVFVNCWNNPMTYRSLYDRMQKIGRSACVKELKPHRMRHTYSTNFLNSSGDIEQLQRQLAHEHLSTTQIYAKNLEKAIRPAIERLQKYHDRL
ncbi:MAG: tyrosine-type recombinase/integrase [Sedimentisphaerales bacterium]|nr:tyrosine-type recombinase/integrase [Sedimentisphaerales bacterium]